jgi:hypothetical protein
VVFSVAGVLAVVLVVLLYKRRRVKATLSSKASAIDRLDEPLATMADTHAYSVTVDEMLPNASPGEVARFILASDK